MMNEIMITKDAAEYIRVTKGIPGVTESTLVQWRCKGKGPVYVKMGGKRVFYRKEDLDDFVSANLTRVQGQINTERIEPLLMRVSDVLAMTGISSSATLYDLIRRGDFPKPVKLGRSSFWPKEVVEKWLESLVRKNYSEEVC